MLQRPLSVQYTDSSEIRLLVGEFLQSCCPVEETVYGSEAGRK
jgi:hypothetical protein